MPFIKIKENESLELALRKFKRICEKSGILSELRKREYYEKPTIKRKKDKAAAYKRFIKKQNILKNIKNIFNPKNKKKNKQIEL